jgi:hypothetical protein
VAELTRQFHLGAAVVGPAGDRRALVGIVTDRDIVVEAIAAGLSPAVPTAAPRASSTA